MTNSDEQSGLRRPPRRFLLVVAAVVAAVVVLGGCAASGEPGSADKPAPGVAATEPAPGSSAGPVSPGGAAMASCVEMYDLKSLAERDLAFAGTVERVDGDNVTFAVSEWYRGGENGRVTLAGAGGISGLTSAGPATTVEPGTRLLVAGDGGFAWSCGFTQPYDPAVAQQWQQATAR